MRKRRKKKGARSSGMKRGGFFLARLLPSPSGFLFMIECGPRERGGKESGKHCCWRTIIGAVTLDANGCVAVPGPSTVL